MTNNNDTTWLGRRRAALAARREHGYETGPRKPGPPRSHGLRGWLRGCTCTTCTTAGQRRRDTERERANRRRRAAGIPARQFRKDTR